MEFSNRSNSIQPSITLSLSAKAKALKAEGKDVLSFTAGEPDFDTPEVVKAAAVEGLNQGLTKYAPVAGLPKLREEVAKTLNKRWNEDFKAEQVIVSTGAKQSVFNFCLTILNPEDEVIIFAPYWVSYPEIINFCGAKARVVALNRDDGFSLDQDSFKSALNDKTKLVIVNSPNNPSGSVLSQDELEFIYGECKERNVWLMSDEIYNQIYYQADCAPSLVSHIKDYKKLVLIDGFSKSYSMTGWRLGYTIADSGLVKALSKLQGQSTSGANTFSQHAAITALRLDPSIIDAFKASFKKRRDLVLSHINGIPGAKAKAPGGAFYILVDLAEYLNSEKSKFSNSFELCEYLLDSHLLAFVPGDPFGVDKSMRISYATSEEAIEKGMQKLKIALA